MGRPQQRKPPKETTNFLKAWLHPHSDRPYLSEEDKRHATRLSMNQISNWIISFLGSSPHSNTRKSCGIWPVHHCPTGHISSLSSILMILWSVPNPLLIITTMVLRIICHHSIWRDQHELLDDGVEDGSRSTGYTVLEGSVSCRPAK